MPNTRTMLLAISLIAASLSSLAQVSQPGGAPPGWVPASVDALGQHATFHTSFTFDRSMLRFANNFMDSGDQETRSAVDKLDAISVHVYHFSAPGMYDPAILSSVRAEYEATGWKHMVTAHPKGDPFNPAETDLWISFAHMQVTGMAVLLADAKDVEVIGITGNLSPLDLLHLRGHFGIPKFDADSIVPAPPGPPQARTEPRPEYVAPNAAPPPPTPPNR